MNDLVPFGFGFGFGFGDPMSLWAIYSDENELLADGLTNDIVLETAQALARQHGEWVRVEDVGGGAGSFEVLPQRRYLH